MSYVLARRTRLSFTPIDPLAITTITHRHADRVYSYELLAREWHRRHG
jgi:hypothetical protein